MDSSRPARPSKASVNSMDWRRFKEQRRAWRDAQLNKQLDAEEFEQQQLSMTSHDTVTEPIKGRSYTLSIALPASILRNAQSNELRTYLAGQIGRAACVFNVDEIIIFDDDDSEQMNEVLDTNVFSASEQIIRLLEYLEW
jgi:methyltransferase